MRPPARLCRTQAIAGLTAGALLVFAALGAAGPAVAATLVAVPLTFVEPW